MDDDVVTFWCELRSGEIVEHEASAFWGHHGHVLCVPVPDNGVGSQRVAYEPFSAER